MQSRELIVQLNYDLLEMFNYNNFINDRISQIKECVLKQNIREQYLTSLDNFIEDVEELKSRVVDLSDEQK